MLLRVKKELHLGGNKHQEGSVVEFADSLASNLLSHKPDSYEVYVAKPEPVKKEEPKSKPKNKEGLVSKVVKAVKKKRSKK